MKNANLAYIKVNYYSRQNMLDFKKKALKNPAEARFLYK